MPETAGQTEPGGIVRFENRVPDYAGGFREEKDSSRLMLRRGTHRRWGTDGVLVTALACGGIRIH